MEKPPLYICKNFACQAPITNPEAVPSALQHPQGTTTQTGGTRQALTTDGLPGHATPQGTGTYVARILASARTARPSSHGYTALGSTGLTTSRIGFGGYRISLGVDDHRNALEKALQEGCNLIDTSTNYADGQSERLVGTVVKDLIVKRFISREEIIIVSKIGYVQGNNLARAEAREQAGKPFPEMVKYGEGLWHCLHPEFLEEQFILSLDRLGLATLDVCPVTQSRIFSIRCQESKLVDQRNPIERSPAGILSSTGTGLCPTSSHRSPPAECNITASHQIPAQPNRTIPNPPRFHA